MKLVIQITLGVVLGAVVLFVGSAFVAGTYSALSCISREGVAACKARFDRESQR